MSPTYSRTVSPQAWASALQGAVQTITTAMQLDLRQRLYDVSLKALMQLDVRQCLIVYVPQLMQPDLKQVGSVPLTLDPLLSLCICKPMQITISCLTWV